MVVAGIVNTHLDAEAMLNLLPANVEYRGAPDFNEVEDLFELARTVDQVLVPFVDTTPLWGDVWTVLHGYAERGFKGIKGIYLPDERNNLGVRSIPGTFDISLNQYHRREWEIFSFAQNHDMPILYHMDSRRYGEVMQNLLDDFPRVRINFAHLGIGRKSFGAILDRYPNVYTDFSGLFTHIQSNRGSYRDFIMHYADRVCFGSDALLYQTGTVLDYIRMVRDLKLPEEIEAKVFTTNPRRFLGAALPPE